MYIGFVDRMHFFYKWSFFPKPSHKLGYFLQYFTLDFTPIEFKKGDFHQNCAFYMLSAELICKPWRGFSSYLRLLSYLISLKSFFFFNNQFRFWLGTQNSVCNVTHSRNDIQSPVSQTICPFETMVKNQMNSCQ